ncbi:hypothetical protein IST455A_05787 [Burkholderia multivorans]|uniref:hypothetical protein n=1 Tax=Burkholderia multivorans TaxID=87883 RepID=UPI0019988C68|nr:hypothetical protein [Burkholderia multivorans]MBU9670937.1 hypothetical protein [Burkholderia multivorans]CAB5283773.1 hypothetical protein IST495A_04070 [Burkholderia multivorans]CAB5301652.1 hypothetical protein IST419_05801 [Burkholderia multivorans]CAB5311398.1 hypothetical protein IST424_05786 [Burkholderia multivorans]CAB5313000.1 hypothetical protein IST455A_05787 [Burkholderia multivorans]
MIDASRASLESRLDNWGNAARGPYDPIDAAKIEAAWRCLEPRHKELLRMVYLWHAGREVVCRRLRIPRHPRSRYDLELVLARRALARALEKGKA